MPLATQKVEISFKTILQTVFFLLALWLIFHLVSIILTVFVAFILMSALNPAVNRLEKYKIPRGFAILIIYFILITLVSTGLASVIQPLAQQTSNLLSQLPRLIEQIGYLNLEPKIISDQLGSIPTNLAKIIISTFSNIIHVFFLLVITFYLLLERRQLHQPFAILSGSQTTALKAKAILDKIESRLGHWLRGQISLMFIVGLMTYLGLRILNIEYAVPLAIVAGMLELIPNIGPTVSALPALIVALVRSPLMALATVVLYFLIQQLENNFIVPLVMKKAVGISPLITLLSLGIGLKLAGITGMILAIPSYLILEILIKEFYLRPQSTSSA